MDFFKKIGKEVSVFGLVFVVFIVLFAYRQSTHVELSTISQDKLEEKMLRPDYAFLLLKNATTAAAPAIRSVATYTNTLL